MGQANAFLVEDDDALVLIDAGYPGHEASLLAALRAIGRSPDEVRHLILTHHHRDHIGSAAAIVRLTGAHTYMHAADIAMAEAGGPFRPMRPAPGLLRQGMARLFYDHDQRVAPLATDEPLADGDVLPFAGGIEVIHVPGHCAGQVALLLRSRRVLFAADLCMNILGLGDPIGFEDLAAGRASQERAADLAFDVAAFGHGAPITHRASERFRRKWGAHHGAAGRRGAGLHPKGD
jgi:glyoxylase-like metal-dependent hydrolase (beta-lactamase superfamily II)